MNIQDNDPRFPNGTHKEVVKTHLHKIAIFQTKENGNITICPEVGGVYEFHFVGPSKTITMCRPMKDPGDGDYIQERTVPYSIYTLDQRINAALSWYFEERAQNDGPIATF